MKAEAAHFITAFFEQNPISTLALVCMKNGVADSLAPLSSNARTHLEKLRTLNERYCAGEASLQNALDLAKDEMASDERTVLKSHAEVRQVLDAWEASRTSKLFGTSGGVKIASDGAAAGEQLPDAGTELKHLYTSLGRESWEAARLRKRREKASPKRKPPTEASLDREEWDRVQTNPGGTPG